MTARHRTSCVHVCVLCLSHLKTYRSRNNKNSNKYWWRWANGAPVHTNICICSCLSDFCLYKGRQISPNLQNNKDICPPHRRWAIRKGWGRVNLPESSLHMKDLRPPDQRDAKANTPAIIQLFLQIYLYWQAFIPSIHSYNQIEETRASRGQFALSAGRRDRCLSLQEAGSASLALFSAGWQRLWRMWIYCRADSGENVLAAVRPE